MRYWLTFLLLVLAFATPAGAAERVLLFPAGETGGLNSQAFRAGTLQSLRRDALQKGTVRVILGLRVPFAAEGDLPAIERKAQRREIGAAATALRGRYSAAVAASPGAVRSYASLPFMALDVTAADLDRLAADPAVISISPDTAYGLADAESNVLIRAPQAWAAGYTGLGQTIAILDTGVDKTHPFLTGKVVAEACFSDKYCPGGASSSTAPGSGMPCAAAGCNHGTHVAGIAAGRGSTFSGVAKDASIIAMQVFSAPKSSGAEALARTSDILAGLNYVYELRNSYRIAAVNLSLGGGRYTSTCDGSFRSLAAMIGNLRSAGIVTIAASGNDSYTNALSVPACLSGVVSVGAVSDGAWSGSCGVVTSADRVACFSNTADFLSLLAPGTIVTSSVPGGGFAVFSGTSMATPHVAGAFAVLRQKWPTASVTDLVARLRATGKPVSDYRVATIVKPRIDVAAAVSASVTLTYTKSGPGDGTVSVVTSARTVDCTASCSVLLEQGSAVTLRATPAATSSFAGWSGGCSGTGDCSFTATEAKAVTASFNGAALQTLTYEKLGSGSGTVVFSPAGGSDSCTASCRQSYAAGTIVRLTATAAKGARFTGWSGACRGRGICTVSMASSKLVRANFNSK